MRWLCNAGALATAMAVAPAALAQQQTHAFDIPSQPLSSALLTFGRQANLSLAAPADISTSHVSPAVQGQMTAKDALERLLAGSGLIYEIVNGSTVRIYAADQAIRTPAGGDAAERRGQDRVIVTGTNIRGIYPESSPLQVFTAEDIARTGATTTEEFIGKLPQNLGTRVSIAPSSGEFASRAAQNREAVNGIDLRGLGAGTTLVLINGRRPALSSFGQAFDVSVIPTAVIERVEVLSDGASAIYGADAVGGVVNFVLREDFDGVESTASYGGVWNGDQRLGQAGHTIGHSWETGNAVTSFSYLSAVPLSTLEREYSLGAGPGYLSPLDQRYGLFSSIRQDIGERVRIGADLMVTRRNIKNDTTDPTTSSPTHYVSKSGTDQYFGNLALDVDLTNDLRASLAASFSEVDVVSAHRGIIGQTDFSLQFDTNHSAVDLTAMLDGVLFSVPAGQIAFSVGGGVLEEEYWASRQLRGGVSDRTLGRRTSYGFGELFIPVLGPAQNVPFAHRLELSLAGRYTEYEDKSEPSIGADFGDKFSPKLGLLWAPARDVNVRATFGESFRAPSLSDVDPTARVSTLAAPRPVGGVVTQLLTLTGPAPDLRPETSDSYTVGLDWTPSARPSLRVSVTYFNIDYHDRISATGTFNSAAFANPDAWPEKIYIPSSVEQLAALLATYPTTTNVTGISLVDKQAAAQQLLNLPSFRVNDSRTLNLALSKLDGIDVGISDGFKVPWGDLSFGLDATQMLAYRQQPTVSAPVTSVVDTLFRPASLRGRAFTGLSRGTFTTNLALNYVDDYENPYASGGSETVDSWMTVDWNASWDFAASAQNLWGDMRLSLSVQNIFDEDPPLIRTANPGAAMGLLVPVGFDSANANPFGRTVSLSLKKRW